jgi:hypothetical protein
LDSQKKGEREVSNTSLENHSTIQRFHNTQLLKFVKQFPWQLVIVLTITNQPDKLIPLISPHRLVNRIYPAFRASLAASHGSAIDDFWIVERGGATGRYHMNVYLGSDTPIELTLPESRWMAVTGAFAHTKQYDPEKDNGYWIKELTSFQSDCFDYGGSVVLKAVLPTRPARRRRSHYNGLRPRTRYRAQDARYRVDAHSRI